MSLHPQVSDLLIYLKTAQPKPFHQHSVLDLRKLAELMSQRETQEEIFRVVEMTIPQTDHPLSVRLYQSKERGPMPVILFFHGGGWVAGSLNTTDALCRSLANRTGCLVVSVNYRLAPEHPFPTAIQDAYAALKWVAKEASTLGGDPAYIMVGGDSAGANVAAGLTLMARDLQGPKIAAQLLLYPIVDAQFDTSSYQEFGKGYYFEKEDLVWCWDQYAPDAKDRRNPYACPLQAADLSGLPPAMIISAEYDVLRDEAEQYAKRLREADVVVLCKRFPGVIHGFLLWQETLAAAKQALVEVCDGILVLLEILKKRT